MSVRLHTLTRHIILCCGCQYVRCPWQKSRRQLHHNCARSDQKYWVGTRVATEPTKNRHLRLFQANSMTSAARLCPQAVVKWPRSGLDTDLLLKNSSESWSPALCLCRYCYVQRAVRAVLRCFDKRSTSMHSPKEILWPLSPSRIQAPGSERSSVTTRRRSIRPELQTLPPRQDHSS